MINDLNDERNATQQTMPYNRKAGIIKKSKSNEEIQADSATFAADLNREYGRSIKRGS